MHASCNTLRMATTIDRDFLRAKYRQERDKRLRPDGNDQYLEPTGKFAHFVDDPYVPPVERAPIHDEHDVVLIGGGFAGLCTGARLKQAGVDDVCIIESGGDVGGAWYWNRYPGAMCDTAAMVYLPLLEETGHMPTQKYVMAPEIFGHAQRIAHTFGLYDHAIFSTQVTRLEWDAEASQWVIHTNRGDQIRARFVAMGTGPLNRPKLPGIPGIETFAGHTFHTSRWDYDYSGGDWTGAPMTKLADKRVGIIGTGATAVQCIAPLARDAGELYVFQRTPSSIDVRGNHPIDPEWFSSLEPGWQGKWLTNFATVLGFGLTDEDLVQDGWTDLARRVQGRVRALIADNPGVELTPELIMRAYEEGDDEKMEDIRARCNEIVQDAVTAEALKPWYRQLCKRPCFHDEYLQAYNRSSCHLVDTDGKGVERIDETGVWVKGVHYELDCLVFASGFEVGTSYERRSGYDTIGRDGEKLSEHWSDGMRSMHGMHVRGFPNLFILGFAQGANLIANVTHNYVECGTTVAAVVRHALDDGVREVEVSSEAEAVWMDLIESNPRAMLGNTECTPGYYNNEGQLLNSRERFAMAGYPLGPVAFFAFIDQWRTSGDFEGLERRA
jgi:cation diffusion facilitator CzcD-associated flavoprotein CzcO